MKKIGLLFWILGIGVFLQAQTSLAGKVTDAETGEALIGATIILYHQEVYVMGTITDFDGNYQVNLDPGIYDMELSYIGYSSMKINQVLVKAGQNNQLDVKMGGGNQGINLETVIVREYKVPHIDHDNTTSGSTITSEQIKKLTKKSVHGTAASTAITNGKQSGKSGRRNSVVHRTESALNQNQLFLSGTPAVYDSPDDMDLAFQRLSPTPVPSPKTDSVSSFEEYLIYKENDFIDPAQEVFSTFSIDVDHAAYSIIRRDIQAGRKPNPDVVRTEEMVNYFDYDYPTPNGTTPFEIYTELGDCPWNPDHHLLHIGLQGQEVKWEDTPGSNLVFLIDVSGSMKAANKLDLLRPSFKLLVNQLRDRDRVAIVVYAGAAGLVLPSTPASDKARILAAIDQLTAGGSTAGGAGIQLAYQTAKEQFIEGGNNRVILATDGDFNVGASSQGDLKTLIEEKRKEGVFLTVLGFGFGNLKDNRLETLADAGNGNYAFIDNIEEAKKVFVQEITGTLYTIAKDVKIQVVFNSNTVESYRLIGYENRLLATKDFEDDTKDAGELGAGHTVTALYEIIPRIKKDKRTSNTLDICPVEGFPEATKQYRKNKAPAFVTINLRYKKPQGNSSQLIQKLMDYRPLALAATSNDFRFSAAVAGWSLLLRDSKYKGDLNTQKIKEWATDSLGEDLYGHRQAFIDLVKTYEVLEITSSK